MAFGHDMANAEGNAVAEHVAAPSLAPSNFVEILESADALLELMGREPLNVVADLADRLTVSAVGAGAAEIAEAASAIKRIASSRRPVALTGAMRALTGALDRAQREHHFHS